MNKTLFYFYVLLIFILSGCFSTSKLSKQINPLHYQAKFDFFQLPVDEQMIKTSYTSFITKKTDGSYVSRGFYGKILTGESNFSDSRLKIKSGISTEYNLNDGKLREQQTYVNDLLEGETIIYYKSGKLKSKILFSNDMKNGKANDYFETGEVKVAYVYKDDIEIEPRIYYYQNGARKLIFDIEPEKQAESNDTLNNFGVFNAQFELFDSLENKICEGAYENGKLVKSDCTEESLNKEDLDTPELAEEFPQFPGGDIELLKFFATNIRYPQVAKENDVQGVVVLGFSIYEDGSVQDFEIIRAIDPSIGEEALRVAKQMPIWTAGTVNGEPVKVPMKFPVRFKLE